MKLRKLLMCCIIFTMILGGNSFAIENEENIVEIVVKSSGTLQYYYNGINSRNKKATAYFSRLGAGCLDGVYTINERKI